MRGAAAAISRNCSPILAVAVDAMDLRVQHVVAEAAADEARFDEALPLTEVWNVEEAASEPAGAELPGLVMRRRLRGKTAPPPEWRNARPWQPRVGAEEAAAKKRPAARGRWPNELCPGASPTMPCVFALKYEAMGGPARTDRDRGHARCLWCDAAALEEASQNPHRRKHLTRSLRSWEAAGRAEVVEAALRRLSAEMRATLETALQRPSRAGPALAARKAAAAEAQARETLRQHVGPELGEEAERLHLRRRAEDARRLRAKFAPLLDAKDEDLERRRQCLTALSDNNKTNSIQLKICLF